MSGIRPIKNHAYYTYQVQLLIDMYNARLLPSVKGITVEPRYGYVATVTYHNGNSRVIYGHDLGINPSSSEKLAKDKGYTKFMLRQAGVTCAKGEEFLLPWWARVLERSGQQNNNTEIISSDKANAYIQSTVGYPVFVKPVHGLQGNGVTKVYTPGELTALLEQYNDERVKVAIVEEVIDLPDYRLLLVDGELVNAYERRPFAVQADGMQTIEALIQRRGDELLAMGREIYLQERMPQIEQCLIRQGIELGMVPPSGEIVRLLDISNLSAGGTPIDVTTIVHQRWVELARVIAKRFNLRICGIDLACRDISSGEGEYAVIEVNAIPGAKQFTASSTTGKEKLERLFLALFQADD